jgi:hypothetical protein
MSVEVVQDVYVVDVTATVGGARVVLLSHDEPFVRVDYRFPVETRARQIDTLRGWRLDRIPITFVCSDGEVALVDERALLRRALS